MMLSRVNGNICSRSRTVALPVYAESPIVLSLSNAKREKPTLGRMRNSRDIESHRRMNEQKRRKKQRHREARDLSRVSPSRAGSEYPA